MTRSFCSGMPAVSDEQDAHDVGDLGRRPERQLALGTGRRGDDGARLHRHRDEPLVDVVAGEHPVGLGLGGLVVAAGELPHVRLVGAELGVHQVGSVSERGPHVQDRRQGLVVDLDGLERVRGEVAVTGDDDGDGITDEAHFLGGQRRMGRDLDVVGDRPDAGHRTELVAELLAREGGDHAGLGQRRRDVDAGDAGVRHRAAQDGHVEQPGDRDVVGPVGAAGDESRILLAAHRLADDVLACRVERVGHRAPPWVAAYCTDLTMF